MTDDINPYQAPESRPDPIAAETGLPDGGGDAYLAGFRPALVLGITGGMFNAWIWMFLPTTGYDLLLGAMATPPLLALAVLILFVMDRRAVWTGTTAIRNLLMTAALAIIAVALFFPVCTGTVIAMDPLPDQAIVYRVFGFLIFTVTFAGALLLVARMAAGRIESSSYP